MRSRPSLAPESARPPSMSESDGKASIDAVLRHLGSGRDLQDFSGTTAEKLGLIRTAGGRKLIAWSKGRGLYGLTSMGWRRLAPNQGLGSAPLVISATIGAVIGAGALSVLWQTADASRHSVGRESIPAVSRAVVGHAGLDRPTPPPVLASTFPATASVQYDPPPSAQPRLPTEPVKVADPTPEEPKVAAPSTVTKHISTKRHRHKMSKARTRRMWAWAHRDERYPDIGRVFR